MFSNIKICSHSIEQILRDYVVEPNTAWRFGLPDYTRVNKAYYEGRSKIHAGIKFEIDDSLSSVDTS